MTFLTRGARDYWDWLGSKLRLTKGGRVVFTLVAGLGLAGLWLEALTGGEQGDNVGGVLLLFVALGVGAVFVADRAFQVLRGLFGRVVR